MMRRHLFATSGMSTQQPRDPDWIIEAHALCKRYGVATVVDDVALRVAPGSCWGLLGPNGAGKTTLLRMLLGKTPPTSGRLRVLGLPIPAAAATARARIGVVAQQDGLDVDFTVAENLRVYGSYFALSRRTLDRRIDALLEFAALAGRAAAPVATLSGGMQRRLALARALINEPALLVLDEPTTGLDPQARQLIWQRLRSLRERGMTLILTSHYMEEAERLCSQVTIMDHGRFLDAGAPNELIRRHIESQVVEVRGPALDAWHAGAGQGLAARCERVGDTLYYYLKDKDRLLALLQAQPALSVLHRPANLEDVFLKLTGRELRDG